MTIRKTEFTSDSTPIIPQLQKEPSDNPLASFFRKHKLSLKLPSRGMWYPKNELTLDSSGGVPVFAMNATDDIKFRAGDATLSGKNIYDVIRSCVPNISDPQHIPHIDLDSIFLAIRLASYGDEFEFTIDVPNTTITRKISLKASALLHELASRNNTWDDEIQIIDDSGNSLHLSVHPIPLHQIFATSKALHNQKKNLSKNIDADKNIRDDEAYTASLNNMTNTALNLICSSIKTVTMTSPTGATIVSLNASAPQDLVEITKLIRSMDIEYFNAIRNHIDAQRSKFLFKSPTQSSTEADIKAGAPDTWVSDLSFVGSNFLPEQKDMKGSI